MHVQSNTMNKLQLINKSGNVSVRLLINIFKKIRRTILKALFSLEKIDNKIKKLYVGVRVTSC